jgi:hypothetical protein
MRTACIATWTACLMCLLGPGLAQAQDFMRFPYACRARSLNLRESASESKVVVFAKLLTGRHAPKDGTRPRDEGSTDVVVTRVLQGAPFLAGKKVLTIPRKLSLDKSTHVLVFLDLDEGKLDVWRGEYSTPALADYVKGLLAIDARDRVGLLRYCFAFLEHRDQTIARDAFAVYCTADDRDLQKVARNLPRGNLRRWLQHKRTPAHRLEMYAFLLGHCGDRKADAALLRKCLDRQVKESAPVSRHLTAYTLLAPRAGAAYLQGLLANPSAEFCLRYGALRAAGYFWTHQGVLPEKEVLGAVTLALGHGDMADLAIETLRRWKCWKLADKVLPLYDRKHFDLPVVRRSIVRYALQCPGARAARLVKQARKADPVGVAEMEELLQLEGGATPAM